MDKGSVAVINYMDVLNPLSGGAERYCHEMAKRLAADGYSVVFIAAGFPGAKREERYEGYTIRRIGNLRTVYFLGLFELLRVRGLSLIFESINAIPFFFTVAFPVKKVRMVYHVVTYDAIKMKVGSGFLSRVVNFLQLRVAPALYRSRIITDSESSARELRALGYRDVRVVRLGVYPPERGAVERREKLVVIPGPLKPPKHPDLAMRAFSSLPREYGLVLFGIYESPEYEAYLKALAEQLGIAERTAFMGRISDEQRDDLYSRASLGLIASEKEGWGLVAMELQSHGVPVVAFRVPGIVDSVVDGKTGVLVGFGDVKGMADAAARVLGDRVLWSRLSDAAYERGKEYSWENCYQDFVSAL